MSLRDIYNHFFEPGETLDEVYVPDEDDLKFLITEDFQNWVPPTSKDLGDDNKVAMY